MNKPLSNPPVPPGAGSRILAVTGASGLLGRHICDHFHRHGWEVRALVRAPAEYPFEEKGIRVLHCNLPDTLDETAIEGAGVLIHCAYMTRFTNLAEARRVNDLGTRRVLELSRKHGVERFIFISSQSAHEEAVSYYGRSKLALEKLCSAETDLVIRSGLILARAGAGLFHRMVDTVRHARIIPLFGGGRQPLQTVHVEDFCRAIESAVERRLTGRYTLAAPVPVTMRDFLQALAVRLGRHPLFVPFPMAPALLILRLVELLHVPFPVSSENLLGLKCLRATDTTRDLEALGVTVRGTWEALDDVLGPPGR